MAKYEYNGDAELVFPTLGIIVKKGDSFEAPDGLVAAGVTVSGKSSKVSTPVSEPVVDETTSTEEVK